MARQLVPSVTASAKPRTEQRKAYERAYRAAHRDHHRAQRRAWYLARTPEAAAKRRTYTRERNARTAQRNLIDLRALKLLRGCFDCGYDANADALQFDHRPGDGKRGDVSDFKHTREALRAEVAKCDVRCANCHVIRTAERRRAA